MKYSIVIPVYNAQESLQALDEAIYVFFNELAAGQYEVIYVDDGSEDQSWSIINDLKKHHPDTHRGIKLARNFGQHNATLCGLKSAAGAFVFTLDDDLEFHPSSCAALIAEMATGEHEVVYGMPTGERYEGTRKIGSKIFKTIQKIEDAESGAGSSFRMLNANLVAELKGNHHGFTFLDEVILWHTNKLGFVEVEHHASKKSNSTYTLNSLFGLSFDLIIFSSTKPLRFMTVVGFLSSIITFLVGLRYIVRFYNNDVPIGFTSLIVAIFFSTSIIMFCLGIVGEYLNKIYRLQKKMPLYHIQKMI